jgi:hypothetical protein
LRLDVVLPTIGGALGLIVYHPSLIQLKIGDKAVLETVTSLTVLWKLISEISLVQMIL